MVLQTAIWKPAEREISLNPVTGWFVSNGMAWHDLATCQSDQVETGTEQGFDIFLAPPKEGCLAKL
jgi:hypothetical protein